MGHPPDVLELTGKGGLLSKGIILDLGCGYRKHPGAIGADIVPVPGVDIVVDLRKRPYPFLSACASEVILSHVLEHFEFQEIVEILNEVHRILVPGGLLTISVPHAFTIGAFAPQHRTYFTLEYFELFEADHPFGYYADFTKHWKVVRRWVSVNIFNDHYLPHLAKSRTVQLLERLLGKSLSFLTRNNYAFNVADLIIRCLPVWLVSIHWKLQKPAE
jgi:SAM-dependent methyltransferase